MNLYGDLTTEELFSLLDEIEEEMIKAIQMRVAKIKAEITQQYDYVEDWEGFDN